MLALEGLSVGDAFGDQFFVDPHLAHAWIRSRRLPAAPWRYTDDTEMSVAIVAVLAEHGHIEQRALSRCFAERYDPSRGYGPAMHRVMRSIAAGEDWPEVASRAFDGQGSFGNGGAMRAAPVGAYFADDLGAVASEAARSAEVTHAHSEGVAGAVAVAVATALAHRAGAANEHPSCDALLDSIISWLPASEVRWGLRRARDLAPTVPMDLAAETLGNGSRLSAPDTVPFSIWCAVTHLDNFTEALWAAVGVLGDRDTICAIVGGIVAAKVGTRGIPDEWVRRREALPQVAGDLRPD